MQISLRLNLVRIALEVATVEGIAIELLSEINETEGFYVPGTEDTFIHLTKDELDMVATLMRVRNVGGAK